MCQHQFGAAAACRRERDGGHRINTLRKIISTPGLHKTTAGHKIHIHPGHAPIVSRERAADAATDGSFAARQCGATTGLCQRSIDHSRLGLEADLLFDGFAHGFE
jgi:hypothetical protein